VKSLVYVMLIVVGEGFPCNVTISLLAEPFAVTKM